MSVFGEWRLKTAKRVFRSLCKHIKTLKWLFPPKFLIPKHNRERKRDPTYVHDDCRTVHRDAALACDTAVLQLNCLLRREKKKRENIQKG